MDLSSGLIARQDHSTAREYFKAYAAAGAEHVKKFDEHWALKEQAHLEMMQAIAAGNYYSGGGCLTYLASGRKPPVPAT